MQKQSSGCVEYPKPYEMRQFDAILVGTKKKLVILICSVMPEELVP